MRTRLIGLSAVIVVVTGCNGGTVQPFNDSAPSTDVVHDAVTDSPVTDATVTTDATDGSMVADVTPDTGPHGLPGLYQLQSIDVTNDAGTLHVESTTSPFPGPDGGTVSARVNGLMSLTASSLSFDAVILTGVGFQANHVPVDDSAAQMGMPHLSANGIGTAGALDAPMSRFVGVTSGSTAYIIPLVSNPDGTLSTTPFGSGVRLNWQLPAVTPAGTSVLSNAGKAISMPITAGNYAPFAHPRIVILWDRPNAGTGYSQSNDAALTLTAGTGNGPESAEYPLRFDTMPPNDAIKTTGGIQVALGYAVIYDDTLVNSQFDIASDSIRGISTIGVGWRGTGTDDGTFATTPVADLLPGGFQVIVVRAYIPAAGAPYLGVTPTDPSHPISIDAPIFNTSLAANTIPDIL